MKKQAAAFLLIAILALGSLAGGTVYFRVNRGDLAIETETLYGDLRSAEGVTVTQYAALASHLIWDTSWTPDAGSETESSWVMRKENSQVRRKALLKLYISVYGTNMSWSGTDQAPLHGVEKEIFDDVVRGRESGSYTGRIRLNDYTDRWTVYADCVNVMLENEPDETAYSDLYDVSDIFSIPLDGDVWVLLQCEWSEYSGYFNIDMVEVNLNRFSRGVYAADGNLYTAMLVTDENGAQLDKSALPGGSWGVWRIPCSQVEHGDGRWWTEDLTENLTARIEQAQPVYAFDEDADWMHMELSWDGEKLLVFTRAGGAFHMDVVDIRTGETLQRLELLNDETAAALGAEPPSEYVSADVSLYEDFLVVRCIDTAILLEPAGEGYRLVTAVNLDAVPRSERWTEDYWLSMSEFRYAYDGERMCVLGIGSYVSHEDDYGGEPYWKVSGGFQQLSVYDTGGELLYSGMVDSQFNRYDYLDGVSVNFDLRAGSA